jgi:hypothetical protein
METSMKKLKQKKQREERARGIAYLNNITNAFEAMRFRVKAARELKIIK